MRKARYFFITKCRKCNQTRDFLYQLKEDHYIILEEYDLQKDNSEVHRYHIGTFPAVVITDANDNDKVYYIYQGKLSEAGKEKIKEELKLDEDD